MLKNEFLINRKNLILNDKNKIYMALCIAFGYSFLFYLLSVCLREYIRYLSFLADQNFMLILTSKENFFYNFFFAAIATMAGISFGVDSIIKTQFHLPGYVRHSISNDLSGLLWISIYLIAKLGMIFGLMISSIGISTKFSFFENYWFMFPLFFFVLFLISG